MRKSCTSKAPRWIKRERFAFEYAQGTFCRANMQKVRWPMFEQADRFPKAIVHDSLRLSHFDGPCRPSGFCRQTVRQFRMWKPKISRKVQTFLANKVNQFMAKFLFQLKS